MSVSCCLPSCSPKLYFVFVWSKQELKQNLSPVTVGDFEFEFSVSEPTFALGSR